MKHPYPSLPFPAPIRIVLLGLIALPASVFADESVDFNRDIRSLLSNNCLQCHGPDEEERAAGLRLDTQDGSREDLGGYAAVKPGDPSASELVARIISDDDDIRMPPPGKGRQLTETEVELVKRWIKEGASYAKHWSYQVPVRPALPQVKQTDWPKNAIDYFTLAKMESAGLSPSIEASRLALARRVSLDLTGLPPTWAEAKAFADDDRQNAYELYVDNLLAKSTYGERWARVWLDLARYADSAGYADDPPRTIWAFRDYVVRSLNANKPFDQFTIEQIAGDLLENPSEDQLIATAFHRNTLTNNEGGTNNEEFRNVAVVDRVNTTMAVWMGTTMACAQCHTHKYDPITHEEYFRFFAFFNQSEDSDQRDERPTLPLWSDEQESQKQKIGEQIASLKAQIANPSDEVLAGQSKWLAKVSAEPEWNVQQPLSAIGEKRKLKIVDDAWLVAEKDKPENDVYTVRFRTRGKTNLAGLRLDTDAKQKDNFVVSQIQATWQPIDFGSASSVAARYVRVELPGKGKFLHLAELQAFSRGENVALKGKPKQSSTGYGGMAKYINDGITEGHYQKATGTHTANGDKLPWIEIDFGSTKSINRVVLWNRTDSQSIIDRLKGFKIQLLDESHKVVWEESPKVVPSPSSDFAFDGERTIPFASTVASFEQNKFPASSVIKSKIDTKSGWAVSPKQAEPNWLTLVTAKPVELGEGILTLKIHQSSVHTNHLLNRFRISTTGSPVAADWAKMPAAVRELVRTKPSTWSEADRQKIEKHFLTVSPMLAQIRRQLAKQEKALSSMRPYTSVPIMRDLAEEKHRTTKVQIRGNYLSTGEEVTQGTPAAFHSLPADAPMNRLTLAQWLMDEQNPLTARVIANRHWEQLFGTGIVESSEEFGSQGELPSHPDLLDWLAVELRERGWDIKQFLKLIVMSATYRQSSVTTTNAIDADPFNRMLARGPRFRVSAEMVRDQALFVSGLLSDKMYGAPVNPPQPELGLKAAFGSATDWKTSGGADRYRRGLYTRWRRSSPYPSMAQFDAPNREVCTVRRIRTNTPLQALVTLNDPVYIEAAQALGRKLIAASESDAERVRIAIRDCLIREASDAEVDRLTKLAAEAQKHFVAEPEKAKKMATDPLGDLPKDADVAEHAAWTVVGNVILNLDEMFMKR